MQELGIGQAQNSMTSGQRLFTNANAINDVSRSSNTSALAA